MTIGEGGVRFASWMVDHEIIFEDFKVDDMLWICSIVGDNKTEEEVERVMRETKVMLITLGIQMGVPMDNARLRYRVITKEQEAESLKKSSDGLVDLMKRLVMPK